jgi:uncharacterized membrane-anchored protein
MSVKAKVKIIKKGEIKSKEKPVIVEKAKKQIAAREMVSTVSDWVSDFQKRKKEETNRAFQQLFAARPQTN